MKNVFFTPGPAEMYPTVEAHIQEAFRLQLGSVSHRSGTFRSIYQHTAEQLRELLAIPSSHAILFTGSATEIWERFLQNCVEHESFHCVNGSFSKKFYEFSKELHKYPHLFEKPLGEGFSYEDFAKANDKPTEELVQIPFYAEVVCLTANETSTGVQMRAIDIHKLKRSYPDKLFCVDMVSSAPYNALDYSLVDSAFFSVQKSFGLPAGLGVWIVSEACLAKADRLKRHEGHIGTYHSLPSLWKNYRTYETPETPNVIGIYLLGKIAEDMNKVGIESIRKATDAKAKLIYKRVENSGKFSVFVQNATHRSPTVAVVNTGHYSATEIIASLRAKGIVVGAGYGSLQDSQIRIANFPAVNMDQVETLLTALEI